MVVVQVRSNTSSLRISRPPGSRVQLCSPRREESVPLALQPMIYTFSTSLARRDGTEWCVCLHPARTRAKQSAESIAGSNRWCKGPAPGPGTPTSWRWLARGSSLSWEAMTATRCSAYPVFLWKIQSVRTPSLTLDPPSQPLSDAWALDTAVKPYRWNQVEATGDGPGARMYAAAAARADGLLLVCGGRDASNQPLVSAPPALNVSARLL